MKVLIAIILTFVLVLEATAFSEGFSEAITELCGYSSVHAGIDDCVILQITSQMADEMSRHQRNLDYRRLYGCGR